jgi:hypothetical protein
MLSGTEKHNHVLQVLLLTYEGLIDK